MARMDRMFGVTVRNRASASQPVSVDLKKAEALVA
jgi:chromosome segregation ATPase